MPYHFMEGPLLDDYMVGVHERLYLVDGVLDVGWTMLLECEEC
jgi:hypothetical protein